MIRPRFSKTQGLAVVSDEGECDIINVVENSKAYDTKLGLSEKEKREKMACSGGCSVTFGEAITGSMEVHNFSSKISLKTTSSKKGRADRRW